MKRWLYMALALVVGLLSGCGGGAGTSCQATIGSSCNSSSGGSGGTTAAPTVTLSASSRTVTNSAPATVTATVLSAKQAPVANVVVNFTVDTTIGSLSAASALTDANGHASVLLSPAAGVTSGAGTLTATTTVDGTAASGTFGYQLSSVSAAFTSFTTDSQLGGSSAAPLPAYGQTTLTLNMSGVSGTSPAALVVTSSCVSQGKATISPASVTNTTGTQTFIYKDTGGCGSVVSSDTVSVSLTGSSLAPATTSVSLTSPAVNSISFVSANPPVIYLQSTGGTVSSTVTFKVVDANNNPLPNQPVGLSLSTYAGGLTMDKLSGAGSGSSAPLETLKSDSNGQVSVIVNSGTVPTPVRVIATLGNISTVSSNLAVVTGLPTQLRFSLAQQYFNIEGANVDGAANAYTIRAADRSGNPVPDGTSIIFWAESGQITGTAVTGTSGGISSATVNYQSEGLRPTDGRATVLAYAIGEESFVDLNGNNVWDPGEPFGDMGDVVKSVSYDNIFDSAHDETVSLQNLGSSQQTTCYPFATGDSASFLTTYPQFTLTAASPSRPGTCDHTWSGRTYVRAAVETILSTSGGRLFWQGKSTGTTGEGLDTSCSTVDLPSDPPKLQPTDPTAYHNKYKEYVAYPGSTWYTGGATSGTIAFLVADLNTNRANPMANNTTIGVSTTTQNFQVSVAGGSPVPNAVGPTSFILGYTATGAGMTSANVNVQLTSPGTKTTTVIPLNLVFGSNSSGGASPCTL